MANGVRSFVVLLFQKLIFNVVHHHHLSHHHHNETDLKKESTAVSRIPPVSSKNNLFRPIFILVLTPQSLVILTKKIDFK
jgi:hypothetical protein